MRINVERLLDTIIECYDATAEYRKCSRQYADKYGHGLHMYNGKKLTPEEQHIEYCYHEDNNAWNNVIYTYEALDMDPEERTRAERAAKVLRDWYVRTGYERLPRYEMLEALRGYIEG